MTEKLRMHTGERRYFCWADGLFHCRWDYDSHEHLFEQMCHEEYFAPIYNLLKEGDYIHVTDRDKRVYEIMVDEVNADEKFVRTSLIRERVLVPLCREEDCGHAVRFKGRVNLWSILDKEGNYVEKGHKSRERAERALELLLAKKAA